jgi:ABC-type glycerol-3-phosphate transport system permease component
MTRPDGRPPLRRRFGRWVAERGWAHVLLLTGIAAFLYPFLWMVFTTMKTDEELAAREILPEFPHFIAKSPYVRDADALERPDGIDGVAWRAIEPRLLEQAEGAARSAAHAEVPVDQGRWIHAAALTLSQQAINKLARTAWQGDGQDALTQAKSLWTADAIATAFADRLARFELQGLQFTTTDARIAVLARPAEMATRFRVESGNATLVQTADGARVDYDVSDRAPIVLACDFELPQDMTFADCHKLIVSLRTDNSWHRIGAEVSPGPGTIFRSTCSTALAMNRQSTINFQPPGFDDTTFKPRDWVPLVREDAPLGDSPPSHQQAKATVRLRLDPSSTARAWWEKLTRNYQRAFDYVPFWTYVGNSVLLVALIVVGSLFSSAFVAYAFARLRWPGRGVALIVLLATMMLPSQVTMVPAFMVFRELGWYNTLNPLWIGAWLGNAFFIFLMIQHLKTIPKELEEAARIDGLNALQTWWYIIVPQLKPTLAAIAIMSFLGAWNEFMGPLIYLRDQAKFPLSLGLFGMRIEQGGDFGMMMAGNLLMTLPAILVFFCFQRYFIQGMTVSGMKG